MYVYCAENVVHIECYSFLISVCMFIVSKALFTSSAIVIVRAGGGVNWLNPFATVLFNVCSAVTVECCVLYPCCVGGLVYLLLCKEESPCCCCLPTPMTLARVGVRYSRLWSTSQLLRPSGLQYSHSGGVCP